MLVGHEACSSYLESQLANLLLHPVILDPIAQSTLLAEEVPVFTVTDNVDLEKLPDKEEVKFVLFESNLNAAPGTDGITSLLYKVHWDLLGKSLHHVVTAIQRMLPASMPKTSVEYHFLTLTSSWLLVWILQGLRKLLPIPSPILRWWLGMIEECTT